MAGLTNRGKYHFLNSFFIGSASPSGYYLSLCTAASVPGASKNSITDMKEIASGNGYIAGGVSTSRNATDFDSIYEDDSASLSSVFIKDIVFIATGGNIPISGNPIRYAVLLDANSTASSRDMLAWWNLGEDVIISDTQSLTLQNFKVRLIEKYYYQSILDTFGSDLLAYWPMNDSGSVVSDVSGNNFSGSYFSPSGITQGTRGIGDGFDAVQFNGSSAGNVWSPNFSSAFGFATECTLSAWIRSNNNDLTAQQLGGRAVCLRTDAEHGIIIQKLALNNRISPTWMTSGCDWGTLAASYSSACWQHFAITVSSAASRVTCYQNGASYGQRTTTCAIYATSGLNINTTAVGADQTNTVPITGNWRGHVQHVMYFTRELSSSEIAFIYNAVGAS